MKFANTDVPNKVLLSCACFVLITQLLIDVQGNSNPYSHSWAATFSCILLAIIAWFPYYGELLYLSAFLICLFNWPQHLGLFPLIGAYAVLIALIQNRHFGFGVFFLCSIEGFRLYSQQFSETQVKLSLLAFFTVMGIGAVLFSMRERILEYQYRSERLEEAYGKLEEQIRSKLAVYLHDTVSKDMARIHIIAENLLTQLAPSKELETIIQIAKQASLRLRPLILGEESFVETPACAHVIEQSAKLLELRNLSLVVDGVENLETLSYSECSLVSLFVKETLMNAVKYSQSNTDVYLTIQANNELLEIICSNQVSDSSLLIEHSNGIGLRTCQQQFKLAGGYTTFARTADTWISIGAIPTSSMTEGSLNG